MRAVAVIPARYASTRFPGKPLAMLGGKTVIEHVYSRTSMCALLENVVVATDDRRIYDTVLGFGGHAVMTSPDHSSGSDRMAEVAQSLEADILVNVQGDEPFVDSSLIEAVVKPMDREGSPDIFTVAVPVKGREEYGNPDVVKVVVDSLGRALYFSRSPIPHGHHEGSLALRHIGLYSYQREALLKFVQLPRGTLEETENLEQLRALENGMSIGVAVLGGFQGVGIDRPEDLQKAEQMLASQGRQGNSNDTS